MAREKLRCNFCLSEAIQKELKEQAKNRGVSASTFLEEALRILFQDGNVDISEIKKPLTAKEIRTLKELKERE